MNKYKKKMSPTNETKPHILMSIKVDPQQSVSNYPVA